MIFNPHSVHLDSLGTYRNKISTGLMLKTKGKALKFMNSKKSNIKIYGKILPFLINLQLSWGVELKNEYIFES